MDSDLLNIIIKKVSAEFDNFSEEELLAIITDPKNDGPYFTDETEN